MRFSPSDSPIILVFGTLSVIRKFRQNHPVSEGIKSSWHRKRFQLEHRMVGRWNALDQHIVDAPYMKAFRWRLDQLRHKGVGLFMD